tara:strand:- start:15 stop:419 length:405 start_codon:yes stop_codon:yes gene_type:complete
MKYYLIFLFVFIPNLSFAEWTLIYQSSDSRSRYYANLLDIKVDKKFSKLRLWTIADFNLLQEVASYKYLSVKSFTEFDCKNSKIRIMGYSLYEENMAKGEIIFSKGTPFEWQKINKDTMNEKYLDIACRESGLS